MQLGKHISITGMVIACILYRESLRPVLLPLNLNSQIIFSGIVITLGYDIGLILDWLYRQFGLKKINLNRKIKYLCLLLSFALLLAISIFSMNSQQDFRSLLGIKTSAPNWFLTSVGSLIVAYLLLQAGHMIRSFAKHIARVFKKSLSVVYVVTCILIAGIGYLSLVVSFFVLQTSLDVSARPDISNLEPPTSQLFSGSSESQIAWEGLGQKGQEFISIKSDLIEKVKDPIRIYAGVNNEANLEKRVRSIMNDFERTKAFDRSTIVLFTPSGSGWVNPIAVEAVEKLTKGDSVSISLQYSNKQAVIQYIMDPQAAGRSSSLLFSKIRQQLDKIEETKRPKFYLYGESLGSLGSQEIFKNNSIDEITNKVDGVIWVGSPSSGPLWKRLDINTLSQAERNNSIKIANILFLYNTTDPIVWSNPKVIYKYPNWLKNPRSPQISENAFWLPLLSFGHLYFELYSATNYPSSVGHNYEKEIPCALVYVMQLEVENVCALN